MHGIPLNPPVTGKKLNRLEKFFLALPIPANSLSSVLIHNVYIKFYTDLIGLHPNYVGVVYLIYNIWNFANDPMIGIWIDRRPFKRDRGKFLYLMRVSAPFMIICLIGMLWSQPAWPQWVIFGFLTFSLFIYDTFSTIYIISSNSFILLAAPTREERVDVNIYQTYVANVISFFATLIPTFLLVGQRDNNRTLVALILMGVILFNAAIYWVALWKLEDREEYYRHGTIERSFGLRELFQELKLLFQSKSFTTWALYSIFALAPGSIYFTAFLYLMDHVIRAESLQATIADVAPMLVVFALLPFIGKFIKHYGGKTTILASVVPYIIGHGWLYFTGNWIAALLAYIPIMVGRYGMSTANAPLAAALIDENEEMTGERRPGLINALLALLAAPAVSSQLAIFMWIISYYGYDAERSIQTAQAMQGIRIATCIIPIVFVFIGIIPLIFFPIDKERETELSTYSEARRHGLSDIPPEL